MSRHNRGNSIHGEAGEGGDLPADPIAFWGGDEALEAVGPAPLTQTPPALEKLGPPPFPRGGFPLMGFLASVYEHVASRAREAEGR